MSDSFQGEPAARLRGRATYALLALLRRTAAGNLVKLLAYLCGGLLVWQCLQALKRLTEKLTNKFSRMRPTKRETNSCWVKLG